jgi:outer membrane receptor protein involved in Fe transport
VPTNVVGTAVQWIRPWMRHSLLVGAEARFIKGNTEETQFANGRAIGTSDEGGKQRIGSAFVRATFLPTDRLIVVAGAHGDGWHSESQNQSFSQDVGSFNPRASLSYRVADSGLVVRGSVYGGFRAPTLNELYRDFRIGNNVTLSNEALRPEKLRAAEAGLVFSYGRASVRATGFWNSLHDTITNVTIATSPALNIRQRQNADRVHSTGIELEGDVRLPRSVSLVITSAITNSRFKGHTRLRNYRVPQVAKYSVGFNVRYDGRLWIASGQLRVAGPQFDDDVNTLRLRRSTVFDAFGSRRIARGVSAFVAVENLFDSQYDIVRLPTRTTGLPRAVRTGIQLALP